MLCGALISISVSEFKDIGDRLLVIFDGRCGLCNRSVRWFLTRDRNDRMRFIPSDAPAAAGLLGRHGLASSAAAGNAGTIFVVVFLGTPAERLLARSAAALALLAQLPKPWPTIATILGWIPRGIRDLGYRLVARFRYRLFGRLDACPIPTAREQNRFL
jgi:predicted DCC family thiol-disulfide oxidoreductase YuxK